MKILDIKNIPIKIHFTLTLCIFMLAGYGYINSGIPGLVSGLVMVFVLFSSVLLHELGHAMAAKYFNIDTNDITLYPFGGIARIETGLMSSKEELWIALAGPLTNIGLMALSAPLLYFNVFGSDIFFLLNLIMAVFNMLPAYPMDGGRVLRSILSLKLNKDRATMISIRVSQIFSILFILAGISYGALSLFIIGIFLLIAVRPEEKMLKGRLVK